jgi:hypothetical protein
MVNCNLAYDSWAQLVAVFKTGTRTLLTSGGSSTRGGLGTHSARALWMCPVGPRMDLILLHV